MSESRKAHSVLCMLQLYHNHIMLEKIVKWNIVEVVKKLDDGTKEIHALNGWLVIALLVIGFIIGKAV